MDVLRDTHRALVPGGDLVDFHPTFPPWARVEARGQRIAELEEEGFPDQLRAAEHSMREVVRQGLFRPIAARTHQIREHYDDAQELIEAWQDVLDPDLERRVRAAGAPIEVVDKVVFRLYRAVESGSTSSPTRTRPGSTTSP